MFRLSPATISRKILPLSKMVRNILLCLTLYASLTVIANDEIMEADSDDPLLIVDHQQAPEDTRLPNSHSAALVMAFIFLCVFAYGAYRFCRSKCGKLKQPLTVPINSTREEDIHGLEDYIKEREAYLAIYGPKTAKSNNGPVTIDGRRDSVVLTVS